LQVWWIPLFLMFFQGIAIIVVIILIQAIIVFMIKRIFRKNKKLPKDAINGIVLFIRFISVIIVLFLALSFLGFLDPDSVLTFSTIFSTAIGFASAIAVGNLIAGIYIMTSRPYRIGDYVQIGEIEGFVVEIGLNFTRIKNATTQLVYKVPNKLAMNENLMIYKTKKSERAQVANNKDKKKGIVEILTETLQDEELDRYALMVEGDMIIDARTFKQELERICEKWATKFGRKPEILFDYISFRVKTRIVITAKDMHEIQEPMSEFLDDIWFSLYGEKREGD